MTAQDLKNSILQLAIQGKLVEQREEEGTAEELYKQIQEEKQKLIKEKKIKKSKPLPEITEEEIPFEIPDSWKWVRLESTGFTQTGNTPKRNHAEYFGNYIPFITPGDIQKYRIKYNNQGISHIGINKARITKEKSILQVCIGGSIGKCAISIKDVAFNQQINAIMPIQNNHLYIFYILSSPFIIKTMINNSTGTATPIINKTAWDQLLVPLPPLEEQKRIVEKIEELMPYIDKYDKVYNELTKLNNSFPTDIEKSILQYAIQGKLVEQREEEGTAEELYKQIQEEKQRLIKEKKIKKSKPLPEIKEDEIPFDIPDSWKWVRLGDIVTKLTDGAHKTPTYVKKGIPFLSVKDLSKGKIDFTNTRYISKNEHQRLYNRCNPEKGDILLTKVGTTGIPVIVDSEKEFSLFVSVALLKFNNTLLYNKFLLMTILSPLVQFQAKENTKGVGNKNWVMRDISNTIIPIPPLEEQKRIVEKIEELMKYTKKLN